MAARERQREKEREREETEKERESRKEREIDEIEEEEEEEEEVHASTRSHRERAPVHVDRSRHDMRTDRSYAYAQTLGVVVVIGVGRRALPVRVLRIHIVHRLNKLGCVRLVGKRTHVASVSANFVVG